MMREVTGAFFGARRLDEALEDLRAEGITGDRVRVANMSGFADLHACLERSASSPTQWITVEYAGSDQPPSFPAKHIVSLGIEASEDDILPDLERESTDEGDFFNGLMHVMVSIHDDAEMRAVCDIFSRLSTDDIDIESAAA